jgi:hypothetical protein
VWLGQSYTSHDVTYVYKQHYARMSQPKGYQRDALA